MSTESAFVGEVADRFADHAETVRGHVRYDLIRRNLSSIVSDTHLEIADVGGGSGLDALWLARLGQLQKAETRFKKESATIRSRVKLVQGTATELVTNEASPYDLVLSHGVAMYLDEPATFIRSLVRLAKPGGHVSLLEKGYFGAQTALVTEGKYDELTRLRQTSKFINHMGKLAWAFRPDNLIDYLEQAGVWETRWSGVRVLHDRDYRLACDVEPAELAAVLEAEHQAGTNEYVRGSAQMLHFIAETT
jgi:S-adenosylmethionine-dependent methyltransferase